MNRLTAFYLSLTAVAFIAAPLLINTVEGRLNALEDRLESRVQLVQSIQ
tara:strand:- start:477 stop:623 length:147 start_codon:yes stop_codon:yes gene_type:complete